jgi:hypothetical protein
LTECPAPTFCNRTASFGDEEKIPPTEPVELKDFMDDDASLDPSDKDKVTTTPFPFPFLPPSSPTQKD